MRTADASPKTRTHVITGAYKILSGESAMYFISSSKVHLNAVASVDSDLSFPLAVFYAMHRLERRLEDAA